MLYVYVSPDRTVEERIQRERKVGKELQKKHFIKGVRLLSVDKLN